MNIISIFFCKLLTPTTHGPNASMMDENDILIIRYVLEGYQISLKEFSSCYDYIVHTVTVLLFYTNLTFYIRYKCPIKCFIFLIKHYDSSLYLSQQRYGDKIIGTTQLEKLVSMLFNEIFKRLEHLTPNWEV